MNTDTMKPARRLTKDERFFFDRAGWSYQTATETAEQGRTNCAAGLAMAEIEGRRLGFSFEWMIDPDTDSSDFSDDSPAWALYGCVCKDRAGRVLASLWAIDLGRRGMDARGAANHCRVFEAELAQEAINEGAE